MLSTLLAPPHPPAVGPSGYLAEAPGARLGATPSEVSKLSCWYLWSLFCRAGHRAPWLSLPPPPRPSPCSTLEVCPVRGRPADASLCPGSWASGGGGGRAGACGEGRPGARRPGGQGTAGYRGGPGAGGGLPLTLMGQMGLPFEPRVSLKCTESRR